MYTACFVNDKDNIYLILGNYKYKIRKEYQFLKVFNLEGEIIKEIKNSYIQALSIESYFDKTSSTNYIVRGSRDAAVSYDFDKNECYQKYHYYDWNCIFSKNYNNYSITIYSKENIVILINSYECGIIGI